MADQVLLERFNREIKSKVPHWHKGGPEPTVVNPTPLVNITGALVECARMVYGLDISGREATVLGKFESGILGGSIKVRPAVQIIEEAISSGKLVSGQRVFEATSGNFGIALGVLADLGLEVFVLVSRKLQEGVFEELRNGKVRTINLDVDICPAPGSMIDVNLMNARDVASSVRESLAQFGLETSKFDDSHEEVEALLARQDVINLSKVLAKIYGGFCPEQYDNELNVKAHEAVTAPEIDLQAKALGYTISDFEVVCTFGTGGTSGGLCRYMEERYGKKSVRAVFPLANQDVAGIRTKDKAERLKFYEPTRYAGVHEADFGEARRLLSFFVSKGYDIGESSALALYAVLQMLNYGVGKKFIVILPDGIQKYRKSLEAERERGFEVTLQEASSGISSYEGILWTHTNFVPGDEGIKLIASSLGCDEQSIKVVDRQEVERLLAEREIPESLASVIPKGNGRLLLVCMSGNVSTRVAQLLSSNGVNAESLEGGIMGLSARSGKKTPDLVKVAG